MENVRDQALEKMIVELATNKIKSIDKIHTWLCNQNDDELFAGIVKDGKTLLNAFKYCANKAKDQQVDGGAMVDDEDVYEWVVEYFKSNQTAIQTSPFKATTSGKTKKTYNNDVDDEDDENQNYHLKQASQQKNKKHEVPVVQKPETNQISIFDELM